MTLHPRVLIIILNWNGLNDTMECLESLKKITYPNYRVVLVDNGSQGDDARALTDRYCDYIHLIKNDENYGFAEGNNIAIRYALENWKPEYFLLLNNDAIVDPDLLSSLVSACERDPLVGMAGPKVYFHHEPTVIQSVGGHINWWNGFARLEGNNEIDRGQFEATREVDWVSGCALLARKKVIDAIGLLYAPYFAYFEEVDWCVRCKRAGYKVMAVPEARVWHKNRMSIDVNASTSSRYMYYMARNRILFMKRNATVLQYAVFLAQLVFRQTPSFVASSLLIHRQNRKLVAPYCRGIRDGFLMTLAGKSQDAGYEN
jgi:GT2 family glycosyltransferase